MESGQSGLDQCQSCVRVIIESGEFGWSEGLTLASISVALGLGLWGIWRDRDQKKALEQARKEAQMREVVVLDDELYNPDLKRLVRTIRVQNRSNKPISNVGFAVDFETPDGDMDSIKFSWQPPLDVGEEHDILWETLEKTAARHSLGKLNNDFRVVFRDADMNVWTRFSSGRFIEGVVGD